MHERVCACVGKELLSYVSCRSSSGCALPVYVSKNRLFRGLLGHGHWKNPSWVFMVGNTNVYVLSPASPLFWLVTDFHWCINNHYRQIVANQRNAKFDDCGCQPDSTSQFSWETANLDDMSTKRTRGAYTILLSFLVAGKDWSASKRIYAPVSKQFRLDRRKPSDANQNRIARFHCYGRKTVVRYVKRHKTGAGHTAMQRNTDPRHSIWFTKCSLVRLLLSWDPKNLAITYAMSQREATTIQFLMF